jgi:hypothetical protein
MFGSSGKINQTQLVNFTSTWTGRNDTDSRKFFGCAFTTPYHNGRHVDVGGDMLANQLAPKDPIFWRWHQFVNDTAEIYDNLSHDNGPIISSQVPFRLFHYITELPTVEIQSDDGQSTVNVPVITVGFTEGVTGVSAGDLTVNGSPATSVTGEEAGPYVFTGFQTPEIGLVTVNLASGNIRDHPHHSDIRNLFEGFSWTYTIVDPSLDLDEDGVNDGQEANVYRTNPTKVDTDGDGMSDGYEISTGCLIPIRDDTMPDRMDMMDMDMTMHDMMDMEDMTLPDSDGDGISDIDEFNFGTNPCDS